MRGLVIAVATTGLIALMGGQVLARDAEVDATAAMRSLGNADWYDAQSDTYAKPKVAPERDNVIRRQGWVARLRSRSSREWDWSWARGFSEVLSLIVIVLIGLALITILGLLLYYAFRDYVPARRVARERNERVAIDMTRREALPFDVDHATGDPLVETERLIGEQRYDEALLFYFGYLLLALDHARVIHLRKGKTNRMYLREMRSHPDLRRLVMQVTLAFEAVYFGKRRISEQQFMQLWSKRERFHQLLNAGSEAVQTPVKQGVATP